MKIKLFFNTLIVFLIITTSCAQNEYVLDKEMLYHISTNDISKKPLDFNEVIEEYNYIPLNNVDGYIIGKIEQLFATDERIFVVTADGVYCYDFEGNPVYTITNKGNARNEFILCESVSISEDLLYMYDRGKMQIHVYETKTGKFLRNIASPSVLDLYRIGNAFVVEDVYHSLQKNHNYRFYVYNEDFSSMNYCAFGEEQHLCERQFTTSLGKDYLLYSDYYECKLYKLLPDKVVSYLQIDCEQQYRETAKQIHQDIQNSEVQHDKLHGLKHVCETDSHIYGQFIYKGEDYQFFFDKNSKHSKISSYIKKEYAQIWALNDSQPMFYNNKYLLVFLTPERVALCRKWINMPPQSHPEYNKYKTLLNCKPDDNPIIAIYKFRSF